MPKGQKLSLIGVLVDTSGIISGYFGFLDDYPTKDMFLKALVIEYNLPPDQTDLIKEAYGQLCVYGDLVTGTHLEKYYEPGVGRDKIWILDC